MKCSTQGCDKVKLAKGLCCKCYNRVKRGGTAEMSIKQQMALKLCSVENCNKPHAAKELCSTHYRQKYRNENPQYRRQQVIGTREWRKKNPEGLAAQLSRYRDKHRPRLAAYFKHWRTENKEAFRAYLKSRKSRVRQVTPQWVDLQEIQKFYYNCPKGYHVDHIIPINNTMVSGLHVIWNLQYLSAEDNLKKSNKFDYEQHRLTA